MRDARKSLNVKDVTKRQDLPAGEFSSWLGRTRRAQIEEHGADVPCGACTACCKSSYFIHIGPEESQTLGRIPKKLLFKAPGLPEGNVLLGYDEKGHCPMLVDDKCSIYEHRPQTCRAYDCRVFTAAGIEAGDSKKQRINQRIRRWKFSYPAPGDSNEHSAVQAAAMFLQERADCFPDGVVPNNPTQLAVLAIKVYDAFVAYPDASGAPAPTDLEIAKAVMEKKRQFEATRPGDPDIP
jgi:Fe-S-cluster containining protein